MTEQISSAFESMVTELVMLLPEVVASIVIFCGALALAALVTRAISAALSKRGASPEATLLTCRLLRWTIIVLGVIAALGQVGFNVTAFLTGLGVLGFTIGFAIQDVSKNLVAGLLLLLQQPFELGSVVTIGDYTGSVRSIDLRATVIRTFDGRTVLIPNADVYSKPIVNFGKGTKRRLDVSAGVAYESDLDHVSEVGLAAIRAIPGVLEDPAPALMYTNLGAFTVDFTLYYWIDTGETGWFYAKNAGIMAIKTAFEREGIDMPFPIQTVHVKQ